MDRAQAELEGQKNVYDAETALWLSQRAEIAEQLQLEQGGIETDLLRTATSEMDIVLADVPVGVQSRVKVGQSCEAKFFGIPGQVFTGKVNSIVQKLCPKSAVRCKRPVHHP